MKKSGEVEKIINQFGKDTFKNTKFKLAITLFDKLVLSEKFEEFLTLQAYQFLFVSSLYFERASENTFGFWKLFFYKRKIYVDIFRFFLMDEFCGLKGSIDISSLILSVSPISLLSRVIFFGKFSMNLFYFIINL